MIFTRTAIEGTFIVDLEPKHDHRGSFARAFCKREFGAYGVDFEVLQCNLVHTLHAGTVRGMHFLSAPSREQKLIRCIRGAVFDALVDMRPQSPSYRRAEWIELDGVGRRALFVPSGVAHGYQCLAADTEMLYMTDQYYAPGMERGVRFDDPALAIPWPLAPRDLSDRDRDWPLLVA